jgi:hypothetical protein
VTKSKISLSAYVKKRNGVPMGASRSLRNMLRRSLGAGSFALFWHYWNPIWGFYLARNIMQPLSAIVPRWLAVMVTFSVSGLLHDAAVSLVKWQLCWFFSSWFTLMGGIVVLSAHFALNYSAQPWWRRAAINSLFLVSSFLCTQGLLGYLPQLHWGVV